MQKIVLTVVSLNVIVVVPLLVYIALALQTLVWDTRVTQSKIDTIMLKHELYLKRLNHERYKEPRVTDSQGKD